MSSLLDKEMPQPRKRRPFFWWAAVAVLTGLFFIYEHLHTGQLPVSNIPLPESGGSAAAGNSSDKVTSFDSNTGKNNAVALNKTAPTPDDNSQTDKVSGAGKKISTGCLFKEEQKSVSVAEVISSQNNISASHTFSTDAFNTSVLLSENREISNARSRNEELSLLEIPYPVTFLTNIQVLPELEELPSSQKVQKRAKKNPSSKISLGLIAGANAFQVKQVPGFVGGLTLDLLLPHRKFGLQAGLLYRYQVFSGESRPVIPIAYDKYVRATANYDIQPKGFPSSWIYLSAKNSVLIPVMKSHQIELPVTLFWQLHSRWRLYAGMSVLRHVWVESADKGLFTYDLQVITTPDADAAGNLNNAITGQLPAWEKNWQAGLSFKPLKRLELGLFYRAAWRGKPLLSDASTLFDGCSTCHDSYPEAAQRTGQSIRPRSLQLNATFKF